MGWEQEVKGEVMSLSLIILFLYKEAWDTVKEKKKKTLNSFIDSDFMLMIIKT